MKRKIIGFVLAGAISSSMLAVPAYADIKLGDGFDNPTISTVEGQVAEENFGSQVSDIMCYLGNDAGITMAGGELNVNTAESFQIDVREDKIDEINSYWDSAVGAIISFDINYTSADELKLNSGSNALCALNENLTAGKSKVYYCAVKGKTGAVYIENDGSFTKLADDVAAQPVISLVGTNCVFSADNFVFTFVEADDTAAIVSADVTTNKKIILCTNGVVLDPTTVVTENFTVEGFTVKSVELEENNKIVVTTTENTESNSLTIKVSGLKTILGEDVDAAELTTVGAEAVNEGVDGVRAYINANADRSELFNKLPAVDQTEIINRMESMLPFSNNSKLYEGYQKALNYTTIVDNDFYELVSNENFGNGIDTTVWSSVGDGYPLTVNNGENLNITGTETQSMYLSGIGSTNHNGLQSNGAIKKTALDGATEVTVYFYDDGTVENRTKTRMRVQGHNNRYFGFGDTTNTSDWSGIENASHYVYWSSWCASNSKTGGTILGKTEARTKGWHKLSLKNSNTVYLDGKMLYSTEKAQYLLIGNPIAAATGSNYWYFDNVTTTKAKSGDINTLLLDYLNNYTITDYILETYFTKASETDRLTKYNALSAETKGKIKNALNNAKQANDGFFASLDSVNAAFDAALAGLEFAETYVDDSVNRIYKTENFANFNSDNYWTVTGSGFIGEQTVYHGTSDTSSLVIRNTDNNANNNKVLEYIKADVDESCKNGIVSMWFYDDYTNWSGSYLDIGVNDNTFFGYQWIADTADQRYRVFGKGYTNPVTSSVYPADKKWRRLVFDASQEMGKTKVYLDGTLLATREGGIDFIQIGNSGSAEAWSGRWYVDDVCLYRPISVKNSAGEEIDTIAQANGKDIKVAIPSSLSDRAVILATYKEGTLVEVKTVSAAELSAGDVEMTVSPEGIDELKIYQWSDMATIAPKTGSIDIK